MPWVGHVATWFLGPKTGINTNLRDSVRLPGDLAKALCQMHAEVNRWEVSQVTVVGVATDPHPHPPRRIGERQGL